MRWCVGLLPDRRGRNTETGSTGLRAERQFGPDSGAIGDCSDAWSLPGHLRRHSWDRFRLSHLLHRRHRIVRTARLCLDRNPGRSAPTRRTPPACRGGTSADSYRGTIPCLLGRMMAAPEGLTRRTFIRVSAAGALMLSAACAPSAPTSPGPNTSAGAPSAGKKPSPYPTYVPVTNGPKPDYHTDDPRFDDGFDNFPANPIKAIAEKPGT